ncbi:MAG: prenyltransferase [Deltaproteobacteria bacterium]|nr:prenyltransferase [Deltaproteobacteria bacterium]MBN2674834.1 prenyltransferase [Deltaproteobacteria bacterium]
MNRLKAWLKASRLPSQSYIFMPLLAGQLFYLMTGGELNWTVFAIVHLYGLFMQLYIVYANDYADVETDKLNKTFTIFSGGSRVLADGELSRRTLGVAALMMAGLSLTMGILLAVIFGRVWAPAIIFAGIALLWMYSFGPVKLSYRGGGEVLQMLGVGAVLPFVGYYAQGGLLADFPMETLSVILPTQLACAMATSIPDFLSDKQSDKRTLTVLLGQKNVRLVIIALNLSAIAAFFAIDWANLTELAVALPLLILAGITVSLVFLVRSIHQQRAIVLFVTLSIVLTIGLMAQLAYVASNLQPQM